MRTFYDNNWDYIDMAIVAAIAFAALAIGIVIFA